MLYTFYKPALPLRQHVDYMWHVERDGGPSSSRQRIFPDGAMALVIHLKKPTATYFVDDKAHSIQVPLLAGPYSRSFEIEPSQSPSVIGVHFRPGAARLFYPVAAHELHNADISLNELNRTEADCLLNEICSVTVAQAQFRVMEEYLTRKLANGARLHPAVSYAVEQLTAAGGACRIRRMQVDTGLSHTRLIQLFREHVGLPPKLFCRVRRFHGLMEGIRKGFPVNWAELAVECGYFDQAHLIRDFRAFAGTTPEAFNRAVTGLE